MAYSTINKPSDYFNTVLYTGNSATGSQGDVVRTITGVGFNPNFTWVKQRTNNGSGYTSHGLFDVVRGDNKWLSSNLTNAETDVTSGFASGGIGGGTTDGFTIVAGNTGASTNYNATGENYASWNWLAGGTASSNTDGDITSSVSVNTTSGFSIVTWSGSGTNDQTIGHGLGVAPSFIIHKNRTYGSGAATGHWIAKTKEKIDSSGTSSIIYPNLSNAYSDNVHGTLITSGSTLLQVKGGSGSPSDFWVNASGSNYVAYCFAEKKGFSKFGSYVGNGNADGPFIYTGFKPAFTIIKNVSSAYDWLMQDSTRQADANFDGNPIDILNQANANNAESNASTRSVDYLSNGFKIRQNTAAWNTSGNTFIYMAFAERSLVGTNNIPALAR